jgi:DNA-binding winged helix-turn-helix (wHTH) protein
MELSDVVQIHFQPNEFSLTYTGESIVLLPKEYALFEHLYNYQNQSFSREALLNAVWSMEDPSDRTVDDHIYRLRKKLKNWDHILSIDTIRGFGYRLTLKNNSALDNPLLKNDDFSLKAQELLSTYHLYGQGEALRKLVEHQEIFGIELDPNAVIRYRVLTGDFHWLVDNKEIPFSEKSFFLLHMFNIVQFDYKKSLHFFEKAMELKEMPEQYQQEFELIDGLLLYIQTDQFEKAIRQFKRSEAEITARKLDGFLPVFRLFEVILQFSLGEIEKVEGKLKEIEDLLIIFPWQREQAFFQILKGLYLLHQGKRKLAEEFLDLGINMIKKSKFEHHLVSRVHLILFFLDQYIEDQDMKNKYMKLWNQLDKQYYFKELEAKIYNELKRNI